MTALVGPSGSGKTTITRLVARFWDVDQGAVLVGGHDVRQLTTGTLMRQLSFVFQDVYLVDGTTSRTSGWDGPMRPRLSWPARSGWHG